MFKLVKSTVLSLTAVLGFSGVAANASVLSTVSEQINRTVKAITAAVVLPQPKPVTVAVEVDPFKLIIIPVPHQPIPKLPVPPPIVKLPPPPVIVPPQPAPRSKASTYRPPRCP